MTETFDDLTPKERRLIRGIRLVLNEKWKTKTSATLDDIQEVLKTLTEIVPPAILGGFSNPDLQRLSDLAVYGIHPYDGTAEQVWKHDTSRILECLAGDHPPCSSPKDTMGWFMSKIHPSHQQVFLDALDELSPGLSKELDKLSPGPSKEVEYTPGPPFELLLKFDSYAIRQILMEVDTKELALALVDTLPEIKSLICSCMSQRAARMIEEDIQYIGNVRNKDVLAAQNRIMQIAQRLIAEGEITENADKQYVASPVFRAEYDRRFSEISPSMRKKPLLFKLILFTSLALLMMAIVVLVSWKVAKLQLDMEKNRHPAAVDNDQNQTPGKNRK